MGHQVAKWWILRGVKVGTPSSQGFLVHAGRQDEETLLTVLQQYVLPWSQTAGVCPPRWLCSDTNTSRSTTQSTLLTHQHLLDVNAKTRNNKD